MLVSALEIQRAKISTLERKNIVRALRTFEFVSSGFNWILFDIYEEVNILAVSIADAINKKLDAMQKQIDELKAQLDEWTELVHQLQTMKFYLEKPICAHLNDLVKELCK